ncbi:hypothetical protein [Endozoicomonas sp.]|uniref:hypothetical protein n=1 Tax=Endozoicomonas sp. TaxID=1892382 RepID=UPI002883A115|nr:hypothetical protein [Endozoicomonas sp.]
MHETYRLLRFWNVTRVNGIKHPVTLMRSITSPLNDSGVSPPTELNCTAAILTEVSRIRAEAGNHFVHIELCAGNVSEFHGENDIPDFKKFDKHALSCTCKSCQGFNRKNNTALRFELLKRTIDDIATRKTGKHILFFINDIHLRSVFEALDFAFTYQRTTSTNPTSSIDFYPLWGDMLTLPFDKLNPDSVHLKNPITTMDRFLFPACPDSTTESSTPIEVKSQYQELIHGLKQCINYFLCLTCSISTTESSTPMKVKPQRQKLIHWLKQCKGSNPEGLVIVCHCNKREKTEAVNCLNQYEQGLHTSEEQVLAYAAHTLNYDSVYRSYSGQTHKECFNKQHGIQTASPVSPNDDNSSSVWLLSLKTR